MKNGKHKVHAEHKALPEFKKGETVEVKTVNKKNGLYEIGGKSYKARMLKGVLSPVKE